MISLLISNYEKSISLYIFYLFFSFLYCGICLIADIFFYERIKKYKLIDRGYNTIIKQYKNNLPLVLYNIFITNFIFIYFITFFLKIEPLYEYNIMKSILDLIIMPFISEIFFWSFHYILHHRLLYSRFHKLHHMNKYTISIDFYYSHPVDVIFGNLLPLSLPLIILGSHLYTIKVWTIFTLFNAIISAHSGFNLGSNSHDIHHEKFIYNYGLNIFMDKLLGTYRKDFDGKEIKKI